MNILFFDVETTGLPKNYKARMDNVDNWPRVVQIAFQYYKDEKKIADHEFIIYPDGYEIPTESSDIHRVTQAIAKAEGFKITGVLNTFNNYVKKANLLIAHNIDFDYKVLGAEYIRAGININPYTILKQLCTMKSTTKFCKLPGNFGSYKWPTLQELHFKLFDKNFDEAHDAKVDVDATVKCYFELKGMGVL